jgi:hypothetical protein
MKKTNPTIRKILATLALIWIIIPALCFAGQTVTENELFPEFKYTSTNNQGQATTVDAGTKIGAVNALPKKDWQTTLAEVIKLLLNVSGGLTLLSFTVGGVMMIVSQGNGDLLEKGKKITYYSVAGLVIIAVSYAVVIGVSELQFFTPGAGGGGGNTPSGSASGPAAATGTGSGGGQSTPQTKPTGGG